MEHQKLVVKTKKVRGEDGYKVFSVRIKEELLKQIEEIAKRTGHSRNELIVTFLEYALEQCEIEEWTPDKSVIL